MLFRLLDQVEAGLVLAALQPGNADLDGGGMIVWKICVRGQRQTQKNDDNINQQL